jgi:hypothetical protein
MGKWKIVAALVLVVAAISIVPRIGKSTSIEQTGDQLSIAVGKHKLTAAAVGRETTESFLIVGGSPTGDLYFTSCLAVIRLDAAERLGRKYGDFRKCSSPGASEAQRSVEAMFLYAASRDVERRLKNIDELAKSGKNAIVKVTYVRLKIIDHKIKRMGTEIQVISRDITPSFLVKDVQIVQENRSF